MSFRLVPKLVTKSVTSNDLEQGNGRYFAFWATAIYVKVRAGRY